MTSKERKEGILCRAMDCTLCNDERKLRGRPMYDR